MNEFLLGCASLTGFAGRFHGELTCPRPLYLPESRRAPNTTRCTSTPERMPLELLLQTEVPAIISCLPENCS
ncbi:MAG TPA: hypothetical protein DCX79_19120 [Planctomycetaceae bacterium]|nr:hypothetical protein [Planctomycetaceae bacterium]